MSKKLLIFGTGLLGEMVKYYFEYNSDYKVTAFVTEDSMLKGDKFCEMPVVPFSKVIDNYPPSCYVMFVAIGYTDLNRNRERIYAECKNAGYDLVSYVHPSATIYNTLKLGENCLILEDVTIQPFAKVGNDVIIWNGSRICHHSIIEDHCFIASNVVVSGGAHIGRNCFLGLNAGVRDFVNVGEFCLIGADSWINKDIAPHGLYSNKGTPRIKEIN